MSRPPCASSIYCVATPRCAAGACALARCAIPAGPPKLLPVVFGVSRVEDSDRVLLVAFRNPVSDDHLRALHELVRENSEAA